MTTQAKTIDMVEAGQIKKIRIGQMVALGVLVLYIVIGALILMRNSDILPILMGVITISFAPITAIFYIRDVRAGVFKPTPEDEAEYAEMLKTNELERKNK